MTHRDLGAAVPKEPGPFRRLINAVKDDRFGDVLWCFGLALGCAASGTLGLTAIFIMLLGG